MLQAISRPASGWKSCQVQMIETPLGPFKACWTEMGLWSFEFCRDSKQEVDFTVERVRLDGSEQVSFDNQDQTFRHGIGQNPPMTRRAKQLESAVHDYFQSGMLEWKLSELDWQGVSSFHQSVLKACHQIPKGSVLTYGQLAVKTGKPQAARAVGGAMARNRWPLIIPCHRVVGSNGSMTGYSGLGGVETKRRLLALEGFDFT